MSDYDVGYKKPPEHTRFAKGRSGNPRGRPKGTKNLETDLREELEEQIVVREGGRQIKISKQRAFIKSLCTKAINGDTRAGAQLANLMLRLLSAGDQVDEQSEVSAEDEEILAQYTQQHMQEPAE